MRNFRVEEEISVGDTITGAPLAADPREGVWLGYRNGTLARYRAGRFDVRAELAGSGSVVNLLADPDGSIWAATSKGLVRWKEGTGRILNRRNGLPCDTLYSAIKDDSGSMWLYANCGVIAISAAELERWWKQPDAPVALRVFDGFDGANAGRSPFEPVVSKAPDGRIWFTNDKVLQVVDPRGLNENPLRPPVLIEQIVVDGKHYLPHADSQLPALPQNVQIDYTALSLAVPQKVRFRYKLEGHDEDWQEAETRRQAFYTDLSPRRYRFRVIACNNSGVWNEAGASWSFSVAPAYYQTAWFRLICAGLGAFGLWGLS